MKKSVRHNTCGKLNHNVNFWRGVVAEQADAGALKLVSEYVVR